MMLDHRINRKLRDQCCSCPWIYSLWIWLRGCTSSRLMTTPLMLFSKSSGTGDWSYWSDATMTCQSTTCTQSTHSWLTQDAPTLWTESFRRRRVSPLSTSTLRSSLCSSRQTTPSPTTTFSPPSPRPARRSTVVRSLPKCNLFNEMYEMKWGRPHVIHRSKQMDWIGLQYEYEYYTNA